MDHGHQLQIFHCKVLKFGFLPDANIILSQNDPEKFEDWKICGSHL
jgi:hypothetical protein